MNFGKRLKKQSLKLVFALVICILYLAANINAEPMSHKAEVAFLADKKLLPYMIKDINGAKQDIFIAIYMFKTDDKKNNDSNLIEYALFDALKRGVKVYVVMDIGQGKDIVNEYNRETGVELQKYGAAVVYDKPERRMHSKAMVIDGMITYIGSHNYTHSALKYNGETTLRVLSKEIAQEAVSYIREYK